MTSVDRVPTERFALGTFSVAGSPSFAGVVVDDLVVAATALQPLCEALGRPLSQPETVFGLLQTWDRNFPVLQACMAELRYAGPRAVEWVEVDALTIHAPVLYPRQIFCVVTNYRKGASAPNADQNVEPFVFSKLPSAITGPYDPIILPLDAARPDWEIELGVIIGRPARRVSRAQALEHVAGYTIANDVTNRDKVRRSDSGDSGSDWLASKCSPSYLPMGPYVVPAVFAPDPQQLHPAVMLNGHLQEDEHTGSMQFDVARLIEYISGLAQLWPGDLICTGSPSGTRELNERYLRPGDLLEATIDGLGMLRNICVQEEC